MFSRFNASLEHYKYILKSEYQHTMYAFSRLSGSRKSLKPTNHCQVNNSAASCLLPQHTFNPYISVLLLQKYQQSPSLSASLTNVLKNAKHIEHMFVLCYNTYSYFRYHYFSI